MTMHNWQSSKVQRKWKTKVVIVPREEQSIVGLKSNKIQEHMNYEPYNLDESKRTLLLTARGVTNKFILANKLIQYTTKQTNKQTQTLLNARGVANKFISSQTN